MRKSLPSKIDQTEALIEFLEGNLPLTELEIFMDDNGISKFSIEISSEKDRPMTISSVYIIE